jgi:AcrR family transcriptional regulator
VVLREATRRAGVAPSTACRHFADRRALLDAICSAAQSALAVAMEDELAELPRGLDPADAAPAGGRHGLPAFRPGRAGAAPNGILGIR